MVAMDILLGDAQDVVGCYGDIFMETGCSWLLWQYHGDRM